MDKSFCQDCSYNTRNFYTTTKYELKISRDKIKEKRLVKEEIQ
jgi:hypothetical protein